MSDIRVSALLSALEEKNDQLQAALKVVEAAQIVRLCPNTLCRELTTLHEALAEFDSVRSG